MKTYIFLISVLLLSGSVLASEIKPNACVIPGSSVEVPMYDAMTGEMKINKESVITSETKLELLENSLVSHELAAYLAENAWRHDKNKWVSIDDYKKMYSEHNVRNLVVKYTYFNNEKKKNVFIASALVNDDECSIDFNGYIIVSREF